ATWYARALPRRSSQAPCEVGANVGFATLVAATIRAVTWTAAIGSWQGSAMDKELVYFADPMCSWCYGFAPVVAAIEQHFRGRLPLRLVMGGLRAGQTQPMRDKDRDYVRNEWVRVNAATGQPFDFS